MGICERIRLAAAERNMNNLALAKLAQVSYRTVYSVMRGEANLQDRIVAKFAHALQVSTEFLLTGEEPKSPSGPMMVREGLVYPEAGERMGSLCTLEEAMKTIATQLEIPADDVRKAIAELIMKRKGAE